MTATQTQKFNPELYAPIKSNHLVIYAIYDLQKQVETISPEDVISICFTLFPQRFCLKKYPQWPDSAMIARRLHICRIKRWIAAKTDHEVRLTFKGIRLAERTARALGLKVPVWKPKVVVVESSKPVRKIAAPVVKSSPVRPKPAMKVVPIVETPKQEVKVARPVSKLKGKPKPAPVTKAPAPVAKRKVKPAPAKLKPAPKAKAPDVKVTKPVPTVKAPAPVAKRKPKPLHVKPKPKVPIVEAPKVVAEQKPLFQIPVVSAEEKARARKFVKMMETSDAYRLYKRNGTSSNIGEFDFRSLLLCTMESSPETLARNVELFKGYAGIHNRQDLITFLTFCRDKFSHLLLPEKKLVRKLK